MEVSHQFKATSPSTLSPTSTYIASLTGPRLTIRSTRTFEVTHTFALPASNDLRTSQIRWSPPPAPAVSTPDAKRRSKAPAPDSNRILVSTDDTTRVFDLRDPQWNAVISNGSGGMGKNVHVEFGATEDEVLVWSDFGSRVVVWCLRSGRSVEIKDPKFDGRGGRGWRFRPEGEDSRTRLLALLCRVNGVDVLMLLAVGSWKVVKRVELGTVDAQGVKWSRDGRWFVVWEAPGQGYKVCVYTADGHLFQAVGAERQEGYIEGLGVKSVEWVVGNRWLAVGGWDGKVRLLGTTTFTPSVTLSHTPTVQLPTVPVYSEHVSPTGSRSYTQTPHPVSPPAAPPNPNDTIPKQGVSLLTFNCDGTLCATRDDSMPTTVWTWDMRALRLKAISIQHAAVKSLQWHPTNPSHLLIQSAHDEATIYLWTFPSLSASTSSSEIPPPSILTLALPKPTNSSPTKWSSTWLLPPSPEKKPCLLFGHQQGYVLVWPEGKDAILRFEKEDSGSGDESEDSLFEILTGRKEVPRLEDVDMNMDQGMGEDEDEAGLDDTFREKRTGTSRRKSEFWESGMSEMF